MEILIEVSARHLHLSQADAEQLFGKGYVFQSRNALSQAGQSAAEETVLALGADGRALACRVILPHRGATQLELSRSEARQLGLEPPLRLSGDLEGAIELELRGSAGSLRRSCAVIARRHLHASADWLAERSLADGQAVSVAIDGERPVIFGGVILRAGDCSEPSCHLDIDEANAAGVATGARGRLII